MDEPRQNMGTGVLSSPNTQFVQKFRWTLESQGLSEIIVANVKVHFRAKVVEFACYELLELGTGKGIQAQDWAEEDISQKTLTLTAYDGCGGPIYSYVFKRLAFLEELAEYDYAQSGPLLRKFQVEFKDYERTVFQEDHSINPKEDADVEERESGNTSAQLREALERLPN